MKYNAVRYTATDRVEGLYYKLDRAAERMIQRPSDYEFKYRLFNRLPKWLHDKMNDRNILPEYSTLEDLRENARQLEENSLRQYEGVGEIPRPLAAVIPRATNMTTMAPRTIPTIAGRAAVTTSARPAGPPVPPAARGNAPARGARPPRDTSTMTCFSCGKIGHISSNPDCKNYEVNRARLHAQREIDASDDESPIEMPMPAAEDSEEYAPTWGGSQYESDPKYDSGIADDERIEDDTRITAMRTE